MTDTEAAIETLAGCVETSGAPPAVFAGRAALDSLTTALREAQEELEGNGMDNKGLRRYYAEAKELSLYWKHETDRLRAAITKKDEALEAVAKHGQPDHPSTEFCECATQMMGGECATQMMFIARRALTPPTKEGT